MDPNKSSNLQYSKDKQSLTDNSQVDKVEWQQKYKKLLQKDKDYTGQ